MEEIRLIIKERITTIINAEGEKNYEWIGNGEYTFHSGKVYGIVSEYGQGGETISSILSNNIKQKDEKIFIDGIEIDNYSKLDIGWYMGRPIYNKGIIRREISVKKALFKAIKETGNIYDYNKIMIEFGLQEDRINYRLSQYSREKWRASLAVGYAYQKQIFCFPWKNTVFFKTAMESKVFTLFNKVTDNGGIVILPTSKKENLIDIVDYIIEI